MAQTLMVSTGEYSTTYFKIDTESGAISYSRWNPSKDWIMLGLSHVKRNDFIPLRDITPELLARMRENGSLFYKNGHCQWTVRDLDHGTRREWGTPRVTGIWFTES